MMISNPTENAKTQEELHLLEGRLAELQRSHPIATEGFTKAGIRNSQKSIFLPAQLASPPHPLTPLPQNGLVFLQPPRGNGHGRAQLLGEDRHAEFFEHPAVDIQLHIVRALGLVLGTPLQVILP